MFSQMDKRYQNIADRVCVIEIAYINRFDILRHFTFDLVMSIIVFFFTCSWKIWLEIIASFFVGLQSIIV